MNLSEDCKSAVIKAIQHVTGYEVDLIDPSFTLEDDLDLDELDISRVILILERDYGVSDLLDTAENTFSVDSACDGKLTVKDLSRALRSALKRTRRTRNTHEH